MPICGQDTLRIRRSFVVGKRKFDYFSLKAAEETGLGGIHKLPKSLKVLLENILRHEDGRSVTINDAKACVEWLKGHHSNHEIVFRPARVLMQDFTGVPAVVDLAAMRDAMVEAGGDPNRINPLSTCDLVIDHSVMVDESGNASALKKNIEMEFERNDERYKFLKWGQTAFENFTVVPPGTGICHQVNLEFLAKTVWTEEVNGNIIAMPDTLVGTDSHTTMVNALSVLGWGVGGIEAEAAMLGQPVSMVIPEVIGFKLLGKPKEGSTATDLVLRIVEMLRKKGVVGKFVEFFGPGLDELSLADKATIANMAPEYGATCGFFPVDQETLNYLKLTGRRYEDIALVEKYSKEQGLWQDKDSSEPEFTDTLELDISNVTPSISGPKRPQDRIELSNSAESFGTVLRTFENVEVPRREEVDAADYDFADGHIAIASITSCTNTSNPAVLIAAGLIARNAVRRGLKSAPWVKTSLAPGSQVVGDYLKKAGLQKYLDTLGFNIVAFGCTTCIGNSGPLDEPIQAAIERGNLVATAVLSGNRNFEGRISPHVRANYLASPPLVIAYAIGGSMELDVYRDPLGQDKHGKDVFLRDIWPTNQEIRETIDNCLSREMFVDRYNNVYEGPKAWQDIPVFASGVFAWESASTYIKHPPYFENMSPDPNEAENITNARPLLILGDSITTDHISPAGRIEKDSPAGDYLLEYQVRPQDFNSYGSRRGNHEVMMRGAFSNIRIKNEMVANIEGGFSKHYPSEEEGPVYNIAMRYKDEGTPLVIFGGKEYGSGSSRDWAAKGTQLLGVKAVIVESFERIHRSNLVGMGVLPLEFKDDVTRRTLNLNGSEIIDLDGLENGITPGMDVQCTIRRPDGSNTSIFLFCRIDTLDEVDYYLHGGILHYVLRKMIKEAA